MSKRLIKERLLELDKDDIRAADRISDAEARRAALCRVKARLGKDRYEEVIHLVLEGQEDEPEEPWPEEPWD